MPDIEIVIKMSEEEYSRIKENDMGFYNGRFFQMVRNGTVLPKGHGKLKDVDDLCVTTLPEDGLGTEYEPLKYVSYSDIELAPTLVEADKEKKDAYSN